jgi:hypothetical protein
VVAQNKFFFNSVIGKNKVGVLPKRLIVDAKVKGSGLKMNMP